jgi:hypothetical protein
MESQLESSPALSRRRFVQTAAIAAAGMTGSLVAPSRALANGGDGDHHHHDAAVPPDPISGGIQIPGGPQIHIWAPGDPSITLPFSGSTLMGFDVDPSTITDFGGFSAVAFHAGTATGSDGATYNVETDLRAYKGSYIAADGRRRFASFAFI